MQKGAAPWCRRGSGQTRKMISFLPDFLLTIFTTIIASTDEIVTWTCYENVVHAMMATICGYCCSTQALFYRVQTDKSEWKKHWDWENSRSGFGRSKNKRCARSACLRQLLRVQELQKQLEGLHIKLKGMVQASHPVQSHTHPSVSITIYTMQAWLPCLFANVTVDTIFVVNIVKRNSGKKANHLASLARPSPVSWCCPLFVPHL